MMKLLRVIQPVDLKFLVEETTISAHMNDLTQLRASYKNWPKPVSALLLKQVKSFHCGHLCIRLGKDQP